MLRSISFFTVLVLFACSSTRNISYPVTEGRESKKMVLVPFEDAQFIPLNPDNPNSSKMALLWGSLDQGPSAVLLGINMSKIPPHSHTSDYHLLLIEGNMRHWAAEEQKDDAKLLSPGSYWFQPGNQAHVDACLTDECLMFIKWNDSRDAILIEPPEKNQ